MLACAFVAEFFDAQVVKTLPPGGSGFESHREARFARSCCG